MIKTYNFNYDVFEASAKFEVNTEMFTPEIAQETLNFFIWDYDKDADPIDEVLKKYAIEAIRIATMNNYNDYGVIIEFDNNEGYCKLDGSMGIKLLSVMEYEFDDSKLDVTIEEKEESK